MTNHLERIGSRPRPAGSAAAREAQDYCANELEKLGFTVKRQGFTFSALPGRYGAPILGVVGLALASVVTAIAIRSATAPVRMMAIGAIVIEFLLLVAISRGSSLRLFRESAENLEAVRGGVPRIWLVAHIDSKSQPVSTALRTSGIVLLTASLVTTLLLSPTPSGGLASFIVVTAVLGGGILASCVVRNHSDGAADNASGVATVLEAAAQVRRDLPLGVLITDAEELFLAGALAWTEARRVYAYDGRPPIAINCDTIDDDGLTTIFHYRSASTPLVRAAIDAVSVSHAPPPVQDGKRMRVFGTTMRVMRPLPGVLTDSVPFHRAGWQTLTLSRGSLRTLARIHTRRDSLRELRGTGIPMVARAMAILVEGLS